MNVPRQINGMTVIEHATFAASRMPSGDVPPEIGPSLQRVRHVAICDSGDRRGYRTIFCNDDWDAVTSEFNETLLSARLAPHREFGEDIEWQIPGYSIAKFFAVAHKYIAYSIIASVLLAALRRLDLVNSLVVNIAGLAVLTTFTIFMLTIWVLVGYVATKSGGWLYGLMHMALVVLLTPVCLVGLFTIPSLVMDDVWRWHNWTESQPNPNTTATAQ